jgi:hypothetical protein
MLSHEGIVSCLGVKAVGGDPSFLLGALECAFAVRIPAVVELALIFVGPLLSDVMRAVNRATRPVHKKRLVRLKGFVPMQPGDRVIGQILAEVVALLHGFWRQDARRIANQVWLVLRGFPSKETVEILEAKRSRPVFERPGRGRLLSGRIVPLPPGGRGVSVVLEHVGDQRTALRDMPRITVPVIR